MIKIKKSRIEICEEASRHTDKVPSDDDDDVNKEHKLRN